MKYYVDLPTVDGPWVHVACFDTKEEAVDFIREHIGICDEDGNVCLLSTVDDGEGGAA